MRTLFVAVCFTFVTWTAWSAEVLFDDGVQRVVSGDWAARTGRGFENEPKAVDVGLDQVTTLLNAVLPEQTPYPAAAVQKAIAKYGWAQLESEPEVATDRTIYKIFAAKGGNALTIESYGLDQGMTGRAAMSLSDGVVSVTDIDVTENLDRSVYESLLSPENFVLSQEHFTKQFFESMLDLSLPELSRVSEAYKAGKHALALYEVAEYYRRKTSPESLLRKPSGHPESTTDPAGDKILQHVFDKKDDVIDMGPDIDWNRQPEGVSSAEWLWNFNSHHHFVVLLEAYLKTANEKYAQEFARQVTDFVIQNPAPPYTLTRVGSWRNLEAGNRMMESWPRAFYGFLSSPSFTPQAMALMLGSIWSHGEYIYAHPSGLRRPSNWSVIDSSGLLAAGAYWPEFAEALKWRDTGFARLQEQLALQVYPDGAQYELAPGYHMYCLDRFKQGMRLAKETGCDIPGEYSNGIESMYEYLMWLAKPDRTTPAFSDSGRNAVSGVLREGAQLFSRNDLLYVATDGAEGTAPDGTSRLLPYAGYAIQRSDWTPDALYLAFDGGPVGTNHQHDDKLSFVLSAYGRNFIIDPGPHVYTPDAWRRWCVGTAAHSTVLIDHQGQRRMRLGVELTAEETPDPVWISNEVFDYVCATYNSGYGPDGIEVVHKRHIVFVKPVCWILVDQIVGEGEHTIETLFHFAQDQEVRRPGGMTTGKAAGFSVTTQNEQGPNLIIRPISLSRTSMDVISGQEEPDIQGWDAIPSPEMTPAPTLVYAQEAQLPVTNVYGLFPKQEWEPGPDYCASSVSNDSIMVRVLRSNRKVDEVRIYLNENRAEVFPVDGSTSFP